MAPLSTVTTRTARDRADLGRVARRGVLNLAGAGYAGLAGFGITWLVARGLQPAQAGVFFAATAVFTIAVTVAKLGTQTGLVYWPAQLRAQGRLDLLRPCLRIALSPVLLTSAVLAAGLWFTGRLNALAFFLPLAALTDALLAATRGCRRPRPTVLLDKLLRPTLQLGALAVALWLAEGSPGAFTLAWAWAYVPVVLLAWRSARRAVSRPEVAPPDATLTPATLRKAFWKFTAPRALASVAQQAVQRVDIILLAALVGFTQAAYYAVAGRFVIVGQLANQALSYSVQPRLADLLATGDKAATKALYQSATGWLILLSWPIYLLAAVFAPVYLRLFGPGYAPAAGVVVVLAVAMLVASGCGMVDAVLSMAGRTSWNLINVLAALVANVAVDLVLIPRWGASGAACGLAAAVLTNNLLPLAQLKLGLGMHPFGRGTLLAAALSGTCFGILPLVTTTFTGRNMAGLLLAAGLGGAVYGLACWRLRVPLALSELTTLRRKA
ncbi:polysaccharide biosynthesis C-terminal domain-containing protein [Longispora albida]|uniref:polysaccharide biosynthesis C-terminal domain-containing protein n=1 Tax=Longispora albida TaxID=203523 RepID=UPI0003646D00|nr:polysaccharide biosynthesis C-terminal domain-containing protein [Longispora albida]